MEDQVKRETSHLIIYLVSETSGWQKQSTALAQWYWYNGERANDTA
jgi:hypothetical protein